MPLCVLLSVANSVILSVAEGSLELGESLLEEILRFAQEDRKRDSTERTSLNDIKGRFQVLG